MSFNDTAAVDTFHQARERAEVDEAMLVAQITAFLENFGTPYLLGKQFCGIIGEGGGQEKFQRLLEVTGFSDAPYGFCDELVHHLLVAENQHRTPLQINGVTIPQLLLMTLLEKLIPGNKFVSIKDVAQLERLTNMAVAEDQRAKLQEVIDTHPVRLSMHIIRQMRLSNNVAYQYLPFVEELDPAGHTDTWTGRFHQGILEQMYRNRVIFLLNMSCPAYCRFCFRKHKDSRNQTNPSTGDVKRAIEHVRNSPAIKEILITGGDPFLNCRNMACAIDGLKEIPHVQILRLATRSVAYYPHLFYANDSSLLTYLKVKNLELQLKNKRLEVATHFIHPDEISPDSLNIISNLVENGIAVYIQTPFLKGCNDQGPELTRLFSLLRGAGAELHYIFIPCSPIHGNRVYWTPISKGIDVFHYLRAHLSDRAIPRICTGTPIGKLDWHTSGWAVEQDPENKHFIWLRTPYTPDYFKAFAPIANDLDNIRVNEEETIDVRYLAEIGDPKLFLGTRRFKKSAAEATDHGALKTLQGEAQKSQIMRRSIVATGADKVYRLHETRVELDVEAQENDLAYIRAAGKVTDVIIASENDALANLHQIALIVGQMQDFPHVNAIRLRSLAFNYRPELYTQPVVEKLGRLNRLQTASPLRVEIETQFLHSSEVRTVHQKLAMALLNHGITVYSNTPLLAGVNDFANEINHLAYMLRQSWIEFHHLFVSGLPLQEEWNVKHPVDVADVIDIGTRVRRDGSGREIPRYIFQTRLGEVDFGLTSVIRKDNGTMFLRLSPYNLDYYRTMDPDFTWPKGVVTDPDGKPVIALRGVQDTGGFLVFQVPKLRNHFGFSIGN